MKTIETKVYKFEELTDEAKDIAVSNHYYINTDYEWWDWIEMAMETNYLKLKNFSIGRDEFINIEFITDAEDTCRKIIENCGRGEEDKITTGKKKEGHRD